MPQRFSPEICAGYVDLLQRRDAAPEAESFITALSAQCASNVFLNHSSPEAADQLLWRGKVLLNGYKPMWGRPQVVTAGLTTEMDLQGDLPTDTYIGILQRRKELQCAVVSQETLEQMMGLLALAVRNPLVVHGGRQPGSEIGGLTFLNVHGITKTGVHEVQEQLASVRGALEQVCSSGTLPTQLRHDVASGQELTFLHGWMTGLLGKFIPTPEYLA